MRIRVFGSLSEIPKYMLICAKLFGVSLKISQTFSADIKSEKLGKLFFSGKSEMIKQIWLTRGN